MYAYIWLHRYRDRVSNKIYSFAHVCIHMVTQIKGQGVQLNIFICSFINTYAYKDIETGYPTKYMNSLMYSYRYIQLQMYRDIISSA